MRIFGRNQCGRGWLAAGAMALSLGVAGSGYAQSPVPESLPKTTVQSVGYQAELANQAARGVHLSADGNLAGRVTTIDTAGGLRPATVSMTFAQGGRVVATTATLELGRFQVNGLQPGWYSLISVGKDGVGIIPVHVLQFDPNAPREDQTLNTSVVPTSDYQVMQRSLSEYLPNQPPVGPNGAPLETIPSGNTPMPIGGGGGGGGLGAVLGAAGLGLGLGGIGGNSGGGGPAPASPTTTTTTTP